MRCGDAMRLGAMAVPPVHGPVLPMKRGKVCGACAIGTLLYALHGDNAVEVVMRQQKHWGAFSAMQHIRERWPHIPQWVASPLDGTQEDWVWLVVDLFEFHGWSRERVAEWLDGIEAQLDPSPADPVCAAVEIPIPVVVRA